MKATIKRAELAGALARVKPVCSNRATLPILSCVCIEAGRAGQLSLTGTDLDVHLRVDISANVTKPGAIAVPCGRLAAAVSKMSAEEISLTLENTTLNCEGDNMRLRLFGLAVSEFPSPPAVTSEAQPVSFAASLFAPILANALPFVSENETRMIITGIYFCDRSGVLQAVATDGRRLLQQQIADIGEKCSAILPSSSARLAASQGVDADISLLFGGSSAVLKGKDWQLTTRLIEGSYPNFEQVIPPRESCGQSFSLNHDDLAKALLFVATILSGPTSVVKVSAKQNTITLSALQPEVGETYVSLIGETGGKPIEVGYNPRFLMDVLRVMEGDRITLSMDSETSPTLIEHPRATSVLMPVRLTA